MSNADSIFIKGDSHEVCQDYALENNGNNVFAVIADGCSSSRNSDIGARIIAHKAKMLLKAGYDFKAAKNFELLALISEAMVEALGLPTTALDATVGMVYRFNDQFYAFLHGDGAIVIKHKDKPLPTLYYLNYEQNMPFYVSYYLDDARKEKFGEVTSNIASWTKVEFNEDGTIASKEVDNHAVVFNQKAFSVIGEVSDVNWVAVLSDGFFSFTEPNQGNPKQRRNVKYNEYFKEFFNFKTIRGEFAKRRLVAFLRNKKALGWEHYDDLSMGVVYFEE